MEHSDSSKPPRSFGFNAKRTRRLSAIILFFVVLFITAYTIPEYGITWDEPFSFFVGVKQMDNWVNAVKEAFIKGDITSAFSHKLTHSYWQPPNAISQKYDYYNNHPPVTRIAGFLSWRLLRGISNELFSMRFAAAIFFALMVTVIFLLGCEVSYVTGLMAAGFVLTIPRLFAFSHFLTTEIFLTSFWVFCAFFFWKAVHSKSRAWCIAFWLTFGTAINIKFTALLIPMPLFLFVGLRHRNRLFSLLKWSPLSLLPAYLFNPTWWHHPISDFYKHHILLSLTRTSYFNPSTFYFGRIYSSPPWHYPLVLTLLTVPTTILAFLFASFPATYLINKKQHIREFFEFALFNMLAMLTIASIPGAPRYDGARLFLPVFPFLALIAAYPAALVCGYYLRLIKKVKYKFGMAIAGLLIILIISGHQVKQTLLYLPYELSYYNEIAGGLSGAYKLGMEASYWLEAISPEFISMVNRLLPPNASLGNYPDNPAIFTCYKRNGILRSDIQVASWKEAEFVAVVNRRASFSTRVLLQMNKDHKLLDHTQVDGIPLVMLFAIQGRLFEDSNLPG